MAGVAVGLDVGGTKLAGGLVAEDGSVLDRVRHDTPDTPDAIVELVVSVARNFQTRHNLEPVPVGVGAAGLIDTEGTVRYAPNLPWADFPLGTVLRSRLDRPVTVDNDANVAAWGEYRAGGGRDAHRSLVMLTVGTGVGGGLVLEDRLVRGAGGMAGELGHITVLEGGPRCPCGATGCLEALASGTAIARIARERVAGGQIPPGTALATPPPDELSGKQVTIAAYAGDRAAVDVLATAGRWLGVGIASLVAAFDPEVVVVGGGAMQAGDLLLAPAREACAARLIGRGHRELAPIVPAVLGDDAGLIGAALLALAAQPWY
ncbi:MAG: ROK family protein [Nitriliruptorales bacterium]|nr:ROK family protein [Nitriliruptorales bacterium]